MIALLFPLAHAGHWLNALLYLVPVFIIAVLLFIQARRDGSGDDEEE